MRGYAARGPVTPDHIIRLKGKPLFLAAPEGRQPAGAADAAKQAVRKYVAEYEAYFARQNARVGGTKKPLDPLPRVVVIPGVGLLGVGKDKAEAKMVGDLIEAWVRSILDAEAIGRFEPIGEDDQFDMEYWSLEQAKLGKSAEKRLARHVVVVTGGAGAIGAATAKAFASEGADVAILDIDGAKASEVARSIGKNALGLSCDVTERAVCRCRVRRESSRFRRRRYPCFERRRRIDRNDRRNAGRDFAQELRDQFLRASECGARQRRRS